MELVPFQRNELLFAEEVRGGANLRVRGPI